MASPNACYKLFVEKQREGDGNAAQFAGEWRAQDAIGTQRGRLAVLPCCIPFLTGLEDVKTITIDDMLADETLRKDSEYVQVGVGKRECLKRPQ